VDKDIVRKTADSDAHPGFLIDPFRAPVDLPNTIGLISEVMLLGALMLLVASPVVR